MVEDCPFETWLVCSRITSMKCCRLNHPRNLVLRQIAIWNLIGAVGFTLCGALGYAAASSSKVYSYSFRHMNARTNILVVQLPKCAFHILGQLGLYDRQCNAAMGIALERGP